MADNGSSPAAASPSAAVPEAVERALADAAAKEGFRKPRFEVQPFAAPADCPTSSALFRAVIRDEDGAGKAGELGVVVKMCVPGSGDAERLAAEGAVYTSVLPALKEAGRLREPLPWPRCVAVSEAQCLVLADLRPSGYAMARRREALDADHCQVALTALARFHAAGLALQHLKPDAFQAVVQQLRGRAQTPAVAGSSVADAVRERLQHDGHTLDRLRRLFDVHAEDAAALMCTEGDEVRTVVHGHCHANNLLFHYDKYTGVVADCRLLDFRSACLAAPACDVAALLLAGTERATRERHLPGLLRDYHRDLQSALRAAGVRRPDDVLSWDRFQAQWRRAVPFGLCVAPSVLAALSSSELQQLQAAMGSLATGERPPLDEQQQRRPAADVLAVLATPHAAGRLADLAQDVAAWGLLPADDDLDRRLAARRAAAQ